MIEQLPIRFISATRNTCPIGPYRITMRLHGKDRICSRKFTKSTDAYAYARAVVGRYRRLLSGGHHDRPAR
jgi:hypothetical protein